jgi:hypothetical protein
MFADLWLLIVLYSLLTDTLKSLPPLIPIPLMLYANETDKSQTFFAGSGSCNANRGCCAGNWQWTWSWARTSAWAEARSGSSAIRLAQGAQVGMRDHWDMDARAFLLLANLKLGTVVSQTINYTTEYIQEQLNIINCDLARS